MVALLRCNRKIVEIFSSLLLCVLAVFKTHSMLNLLFLITTKLLLLCWLCSTYDVLNMLNWKSVCEVVCWRCSLMWLVHWRILKNCDWTATISSTSPVWVTHTSYKPPPPLTTLYTVHVLSRPLAKWTRVQSWWNKDIHKISVRLLGGYLDRLWFSWPTTIPVCPHLLAVNILNLVR